MLRLKSLVLLKAGLIVLLLLSCAQSKEPLEVKPIPLNELLETYNRPVPVEAPVIKFKIITSDTIKEEKDDFVFFSLEENSYLEMAKFLEDILRWIKSVNAILDAYEKQAGITNTGEVETDQK